MLLQGAISLETQFKVKDPDIRVYQGPTVQVHP